MPPPTPNLLTPPASPPASPPESPPNSPSSRADTTPSSDNFSPDTAPPDQLASLLSRWDASARTPAALESLCLAHPSLAPALRSQAAALSRADHLLASASTPTILPQIPGYHLLHLLGQGGMGTVYAAIQLATNRKVALKILPPHALASPKSTARFEREVELAARLDHPHIAQIYESSLTTPSPYYALEFIEGQHLTPAATAHLTLPQKLTILTQIADALAHAHSRGVLHRDLKPSNILLTHPSPPSPPSPHTPATPSPHPVASTASAPSTQHSALLPTPSPKLLDFGLARDLHADSLLTLESPTLGTPAYNAPEQARGQPTDTRSDLFSLGLIATELLTGHHPYDTSLPPQQLLHQIATTPPTPHTPPTPNPSTHPAPSTSSALSTPHSALLPPLPPLPPDLLLILQKSIAFHPNDRYATAAEFAADLQAFLQNRPISARKPTLAYTAKKFVSRHQFGVLASAATLLLLASTTTYYATHLISERNRALAAEKSARTAEAAARASEAVSLENQNRLQVANDNANNALSFLAYVLAQAGPFANRGESFTGQQVLERAVQDVERSTWADANARATVNQVVGQHCVAAGQPGGRRHLEYAYRVRSTNAGPNNEYTLDSELWLAKALFMEGNRTEAEHLLRDMIARIPAIQPANDHIQASFSSAKSVLAAVRFELGDAPEASRLFHEVIELQKRNRYSDASASERTRSALIVIDALLNKSPDSLAALRQSYQTRLQLTGENHPDSLSTQLNLGEVLRDQGHFAEAEQILLDNLDRRKKVYSPDSVLVTLPLDSLAQLRLQQNQPAEAANFFAQAAAIATKTFGPSSAKTAHFNQKQHAALTLAGQTAAAAQLETQALTFLTQSSRGQIPVVPDALLDWLIILTNNSNSAQARFLAHEAAELAVQSYTAEDPRRRKLMELFPPR